jgi:FO synthase
MSGSKQKSISFCFSHSVVLTRHCAYACGYCDYPLSPRHPLPSHKALDKRLRRAMRCGAVAVEMTAGEGIADHPETVCVLRYYGHDDFMDYVRDVCRQAVTGNGVAGLMPVAHLGRLSITELRQIRKYIACAKIYLESVDPSLMSRPVHSHAPCKAPDKRLDAILQTGQAGIPLTTGIMVGIGESRLSREKALRLLAEAHKRHDHIQNVVIERFTPRLGTRMADWPQAPAEAVVDAVAQARKAFGPDMPITVAALDNRDLLPAALDAGANDFGEVDLTGDEEADADILQRLYALRDYCARRGLELSERLPVFASHLNSQWLSPQVLDLARRRRDELADPFDLQETP